MKIRVISGVFGLAAVLASGAALAEEAGTVAQLNNLEGSVLVSQGDGLVPGWSGERLPVGTRIMTMARSGVVVHFDTGCDVKLKENEGFTVRSGTCAALLKEVAALGPASGAIGGGAAGAVFAAGATSMDVIAGGFLLAGGIGYALGRNWEDCNCPVSRD
jgi:hypothetical protein